MKPALRLAALPLTLLAAGFVACTHLPGTSSSTAGERASDASGEAPISPAALRRDLAAFADDSMRGRETGTPDAFRAARFLADRVRALGLEPAGDSLYLQRVPMERETFTDAAHLEVRTAARVWPFAIGRELVPLLDLGAGLPPTRRNADGDLVFVGNAARAGGGRRDELAGLDLAGKVVVVVNGAPRSADAATRTRQEGQAAISDRLARILPQHPAAVIVLLAGEGRALFGSVAPGLVRRVALRTGRPDVPEDERRLPLILLGTPADGSPLLPAGWPADDRPQALPGRFVAELPQRREAFVDYNVVAAIRGRDPALQSTYVALGAHYDHIGIVTAVHGDSIANGADDDGSGSVALLAVAGAMQRSGPARRSVLFVWHVGEEEGLLGSSWFADHPTVPIDSIVAQLNADMIGRNDAGQLSIVGPLVAPNHQSRRLGAIVDSVNARQHPPFRLDRSLDDADHPEHIYERSDHFNYARKGIPIVFFTTGLHPDYHQPGDELSRIDFDKLARVTRLLHDVALAVADAPYRPR